MNTPDNTIGENLRTLRKSYGWNQEKLAELSGVPREQISRYESGKIVPSVPIMMKLCSTFGVQLTDIINPIAEDQPRKTIPTIDDIKFALWGDDAPDITDRQLEEVKSFAAFIRERDAKK